MSRKPISPTLLVLVLAALLLIPQFAQSQTSGSTDGDLVSVPSVKLLWSSEVPGHGPYLKGPLIYGNNLYVTCQVYSPNLVCFDASTGKELWQNRSVLPDLGNGMAYFGLYGVNASTGDILVTFPDIGLMQPLSIADGYRFTTNEFGDVYAFNATTGAQIWETNAPKSTILYGAYYRLAAVADGFLYTARHVRSVNSEPNPRPYEYLVASFSETTGKRQWNQTIQGIPISVVTADDAVYITYRIGTYGNYTQGGILAISRQTGAKLWDNPLSSSLSTPTIVDGNVYVRAGNQTIFALNALDGTLVWGTWLGPDIWSGGQRIIDLVPQAPPLVVNDRLYASAYNGVCCLDTRTGTAIWNYTTYDLRFEPGSADIGFSTPPTYSNGVLYVGSGGDNFMAPVIEHNVYALDAANGNMLWNYTVSGPVNQQPVVFGDRLYLAVDYASHYSAVDWENGFVYCFQLTTESVQPTPAPTPAVPPAGAIVVPDDYPSIQSAVANAAPGSTIFVRNGDYLAYNLRIDKPLTLLGQDNQKTVIAALWHRYQYNGIIEVPADNVTISGFKIVGTERDYGIIVGQRYGNASSNCTIFGNNIIGNDEGVGFICDEYEPSNQWARNYVYGNNFINNSIQAHSTEGILVSWDNETLGNYWSDYQNRYPNATENANKMEWNTPYSVEADGADNHPQINPFNNTMQIPTATQPPIDGFPTWGLTLGAAAFVAALLVVFSVKWAKRKQLRRTQTMA